MSVLELNGDQVISTLRQLPAADRMRFGESKLRRRPAERGLEWDQMSEDERETSVDDLS